MRPPSRGGSGNKLNTAKTTLRITPFFKFAASHCATVTGEIADEVEAQCGDHSENNVGGGPAAATITMPLRGQRSARKLTGTGLA